MFFASNFTALLALRFLQGIGGAALLSTNITIIGDLYSGSSRSKSMGYNATVNGFGSALYPALGGALALLGWNYPFLIPAVAVPVGLLLIPFLKIPEPRNKQKFSHYLRGIREVIRHREVTALFILTIGVNIVLVGGLFTYLPILFRGKLRRVGALSGGCYLSVGGELFPRHDIEWQASGKGLTEAADQALLCPQRPRHGVASLFRQRAVDAFARRAPRYRPRALLTQ